MPTCASGRLGPGDAVQFQERLDLGFAAAEFDERLERIAAAAARQDAVEETRGGRAVEGAWPKECAEGIGGQHLGPLVAVVTRGVAAGEDVREAVRVAVPFRDARHGDLGAHFGQQLVQA